MFNFKRDTLARILAVIFFILLLAFFVPVLRPFGLMLARSPLIVLNAFGREVGALILYHSNYVENNRLKKENDYLKSALVANNELTEQTKRLKDLLEFKQKTPFKVVSAEVIGRSPDNWVSVIILNKGSAQGIKRGNVVLDYLGIIGRVSEIAESTSKVTLLNDPGISVSGIIQRSRQEGLVSGTLGGSLLMHYLPKDADVALKDEVVTSGLTDTYPKGILIGTVVDVGEELSGLSRYVVIKPAVHLTNLEEVFVIIQ